WSRSWVRSAECAAGRLVGYKVGILRSRSARGRPGQANAERREVDLAAAKKDRARLGGGDGAGSLEPGVRVRSGVPSRASPEHLWEPPPLAALLGEQNCGVEDGPRRGDVADPIEDVGEECQPVRHPGEGALAAKRADAEPDHADAPLAAKCPSFEDEPPLGVVRELVLAAQRAQLDDVAAEAVEVAQELIGDRGV